MAKYDHVIHLSEVTVEQINAPAGSPFGGRRQRVGAQIGAQSSAIVFSPCPRVRRRSLATRTREMKR